MYVTTRCPLDLTVVGRGCTRFNHASTRHTPHATLLFALIFSLVHVSPVAAIQYYSTLRNSSSASPTTVPGYYSATPGECTPDNLDCDPSVCFSCTTISDHLYAGCQNGRWQSPNSLPGYPALLWDLEVRYHYCEYIGNTLPGSWGCNGKLAYFGFPAVSHTSPASEVVPAQSNSTTPAGETNYWFSQIDDCGCAEITGRICNHQLTNAADHWSAKLSGNSTSSHLQMCEDMISANADVDDYVATPAVHRVKAGDNNYLITDCGREASSPSGTCTWPIPGFLMCNYYSYVDGCPN